LLWGYFFYDTEASRLQKIASELVPLGYKLVSLEKVQGKMYFRLHLEKAEIHTPETLNERNEELYVLTEKYGVASYDGMDVGPLPK
jgi:regulator of RNase E activity RraB